MQNSTVSHPGSRAGIVVVAACCLIGAFARASFAAGPTSARPASSTVVHQIPKVAAIVTAYYRNSHADVIVSRLMQTMTLDGRGERPAVKLVSLYIDQPRNGIHGLGIATTYHLPVYNTVAEALTLGGKSLAVDGVMLIGEHGQYPLSPTGQVLFPKRRLFSQILEVFDQSGRVVPVYTDKHLADNWDDAKWLYDSARQRGIPLMAGSTLPLTWRHPAADVPRGARIAEIVSTTYGSLEAYGYHGLEILQCLAERRAGGETGVRSVQLLSGARVWEAIRSGVASRDLIDAALSRREHSRASRGEDSERLLDHPALFVVNYRDGLRGRVLFARNVIGWNAAWRDAETGKIDSAQFWTQEARPFMHFTYLVKGVQRMVQTGKPSWPVERTLLTTGILNAAFISQLHGGGMVNTSYLDVHYHSDTDWQQPPTPPADQPLSGP